MTRPGQALSPAQRLALSRERLRAHLHAEHAGGPGAGPGLDATAAIQAWLRRQARRSPLIAMLCAAGLGAVVAALKPWRRPVLWSLLLAAWRHGARAAAPTSADADSAQRAGPGPGA